MGTSFYLFAPEQKKKKILELCWKHACVLLPYLEKDGRCWCIVALRVAQETKDVYHIDIYHWHKQKRAALGIFESKLLRVFPQATVHKHVYVNDEAMSHVLCMHLVSRLLAQSDVTPALEREIL